MSEQKTFQASPVQVKLKPWNPAYVLDHTADRLSGGHWTCPAERAEMGQEYWSGLPLPSPINAT